MEYMAAKMDDQITGAVSENERLCAELDTLRAELERERMRLAACGVIAMANTPESAAKVREMHDDYYSASLDDVACAVDREMELRAELATMTESRDSAVRLWDNCGEELANTQVALAERQAAIDEFTTAGNAKIGDSISDDDDAALLKQHRANHERYRAARDALTALATPANPQEPQT